MKLGSRHHKLLTQEIIKQLPPLYANEGKDPSTIPVIVKFFSPYTNWTWYATEFDGKDTFFGMVHGHEKELGYFSLSELENSYRGALPLVERDLYFGKHMLSEFMPDRGNPISLKGSHPQGHYYPTKEEADAVAAKHRASGFRVSVIRHDTGGGKSYYTLLGRSMNPLYHYDRTGTSEPGQPSTVQFKGQQYYHALSSDEKLSKQVTDWLKNNNKKYSVLVRKGFRYGTLDYHHIYTYPAMDKADVESLFTIMRASRSNPSGKAETPVIFRKFQGDIIALLPTIPGSSEYDCMSYEHVGQHGGADPGMVMRMSKPAKPSEYADLLAELKQVGYDDLKVYNRLQYWFLDARRENLKKMTGNPVGGKHHDVYGFHLDSKPSRSYVGKMVTIPAGEGYWALGRYPWGGDFRRLSSDLTSMIVEAYDYYSDGTLRRFAVMLPDRSKAGFTFESARMTLSELSGKNPASIPHGASIPKFFNFGGLRYTTIKSFPDLDSLRAEGYPNASGYAHGSTFDKKSGMYLMGRYRLPKTNPKGVPKRLQVKTDKGWEYVFCYSGDTGKLVTTQNRSKAIPGHGLAFFSNKYGNNEFRVV
jgi:hypothetical protein